MSDTLNVYTTKDGDRYRSQVMGGIFEVTYVAPAGSMGRSMSEGPTVQLAPVRDDGTLGHPYITVGHRQLRKPDEFVTVGHHE